MIGGRRRGGWLIHTEGRSIVLLQSFTTWSVFYSLSLSLPLSLALQALTHTQVSTHTHTHTHTQVEKDALYQTRRFLGPSCWGVDEKEPTTSNL